MSGNSIGDVIRISRKKQKINQADLAPKIGVSVATLQRIEYGKAPIHNDVLKKICSELGLEYDLLLRCNNLTDLPFSQAMDAFRNPSFPATDELSKQLLDNMEHNLYQAIDFVKEGINDQLNFEILFETFRDLSSDEIAELIQYAGYLRSKHNKPDPSEK